MSKQTSIEWLFAHLVPHLDWSKVEDRKLFRKLKADAEQMHKEEIEDAWNNGMKSDNGHFGTFKEYYKEIYGGQDA